MIPIRGGVEAFNAYPYVANEEILEGSLVQVAEFYAPREVYVFAIV